MGGLNSFSEFSIVLKEINSTISGIPTDKGGSTPYKIHFKACKGQLISKHLGTFSF